MSAFDATKAMTQIFRDHFKVVSPLPMPGQEKRPQSEPRLTAPTGREELRAWCLRWLDLKLPEGPVCAGHSSPLDYLAYVFFEESADDPVIWACRGGGKTLMGAVATLLDMLFKPGIEIRILGGSQAQSERMYEHLVRMVEANFRDQLIKGHKMSRITKTGFSFANGSRVELLAQTESSVRGSRVQKVRCDEVDLYDPHVWSAVQLTTCSKRNAGGGGKKIRGSIEAFSTLNGMHGVMQELLKDKTRKLFTWCIWDVMEKCEESCKDCSLLADCQGKAKQASGFVPVEDVRVMRSRVKASVWAMEMLCQNKSGPGGASGVTMRYY